MTAMQIKPEVQAFFDEPTFTLTYIVFDPTTKDAVIIDPVLNYEPIGSKISETSADELEQFVREKGLRIHYLLETHAHADHLSGSPALKRRFPQAKLAIGKRITEVQQVFQKVFDLPEDFPTDGSQFELLLEDGESVQAGSLAITAHNTPGHTPACLTYEIGDALFTGDALFMPDYGTGRCDFPAGSAESLYESITERIYSFPDETRIFTGHDYLPGGRALRYESTVAEEKQSNVQLPASRSRADFVAWRNERDAGLKAPRLLYQSVQANINAGEFPAHFSNGKPYLRIPVNYRQ